MSRAAFGLEMAFCIFIFLQHFKDQFSSCLREVVSKSF